MNCLNCLLHSLHVQNDVVMYCLCFPVCADEAGAGTPCKSAHKQSRRRSFHAWLDSVRQGSRGQCHPAFSSTALCSICMRAFQSRREVRSFGLIVVMCITSWYYQQYHTCIMEHFQACWFTKILGVVRFIAILFSKNRDIFLLHN